MRGGSGDGLCNKGGGRWVAGWLCSGVSEPIDCFAPSLIPTHLCVRVDVCRCD